MNQEIKDRIEKIQNGEVPNGYKKTKVGIVPDDWCIRELGALGEFSKGKNITTASTLNGGDYSAMMYGDIYIKYDTVVNETDYKIPLEIAENSTKVEKGCLLFTTSGETAIEIGKCVCYNGGKDLYIGGDILAFKPYKDNSIFLSYQQNSFPMIKSKARLGQGHSVVHIYQPAISGLLIPLPNIEEQEKIANILTKQDEIIDLKEKLVIEKEARKKYVMQQLLTGKKRLSGFSGEWQKWSLESVGKIVTGKTPKTSISKYYNGDIPWVTPSDISEEKYIYSTERELTNDGIKKAVLIPKNSVLITCVASIGKNVILMKDGSCNQQINAITAYDDFSSEFIYYLLSYRKNMLKKYAGKSATAILNKESFSNLIFKIPILDEQTAIANILSKLDKEIELLKQDVEAEKQKKKSLMQLLLTGIVRV